MASEWPDTTFGALLSGKIRHGLYKPLNKFGTGTRVLKMGVLYAEDRIGPQDMGRTQLSMDEIQRFRVLEGDLLIARTSMVSEGAGKCSIAVAHSEVFVFDGNILCVTLDRSVADPTFYYYCFRSPTGRQAIAEIITGTQSRSLSSTSLARISLPHPPLSEQHAIANILGTLDEKIELNRLLNETLERIARAIFKSWFANFDPVRAKAEGRDTGLPKKVADLFPDSFEDSELGEIPEGWQTGHLGGSIADVISGSRPVGGAVTDGVPSIGAENIIGLGLYNYSKEKFIPQDFYPRLKAKGADVRPSDVLLYKDGANIGRKTFFDCGFPHVDCAINEHVFILRGKATWMQRYLFFWLDLPWVTSEIIALNSNSAQPGINKTGVCGLPFMMPDAAIVRAFDNLVAPLTNAVFRNCHESSTLAALRDSILPELFSGELRVPEAQRIVERDN